MCEPYKDECRNDTNRVYTPMGTPVDVDDSVSANPIKLLPKNINLLTVKKKIKSIWYRCVAESPKFTKKTHDVGFLLTGELSREKGGHCCSVGELKFSFASTNNPGCKESVFNILFLVLDFLLGAPYTLLRQVIGMSIALLNIGSLAFICPQHCRLAAKCLIPYAEHLPVTMEFCVMEVKCA